MSEEQQAQADKNTKDIRSLKTTIPVIWFIGISLALGGSIWTIATRNANNQNAEANYRTDNNRHFDDIKEYISEKVQQVRTKDSTDIATVNTNLVNLNNSTRLEMIGEIKSLREECRRMAAESKLSRTEHYYYDKNGNRVIESVANK